MYKIMKEDESTNAPDKDWQEMKLVKIFTVVIDENSSNYMVDKILDVLSENFEVQLELQDDANRFVLIDDSKNKVKNEGEL